MIIRLCCLHPFRAQARFQLPGFVVVRELSLAVRTGGRLLGTLFVRRLLLPALVFNDAESIVLLHDRITASPARAFQADARGCVGVSRFVEGSHN